jgi:uncharacterized protein
MAASQHSGNPGNFAEDREKAARAGHLGGQNSSGNFANNRERAAEAGRKGGRAARRMRSGADEAKTSVLGPAPAEDHSLNRIF